MRIHAEQRSNFNTGRKEKARHIALLAVNLSQGPYQATDFTSFGLGWASAVPYTTTGLLPQ